MQNSSERTVEPAPVRIGRYEILSELQDEGVVSRSVARVHGPNAGPRIVELSRVMHALATQVEVRAAFLAEARAAGRVRHSNFVHPTDTLLHEGALFSATEFVLGLRLDELGDAAARAAAPMPIPVAARIVIDVLAGVSALHASTAQLGTRALVHGDITPSTVIIGYRGDTRLVHSGLATATTRAGSIGERSRRLGYKAPEQLRTGTTLPIAVAVDVFAVGVLLWECLAGVRLFDAGTDLEVVERVLTLPVPYAPIEARVPPALVAVVATALERSPERRFPSAAEFADVLACSVEGPIASAEQVAAFVDSLLGPQLESRRAEVQRLVNSTDEEAFHGPASRAASSSQMRRAGSLRTPVGIVYPPEGVSPSSSGRFRAGNPVSHPSGYARAVSYGASVVPPSSRQRPELGTPLPRAVEHGAWRRVAGPVPPALDAVQRPASMLRYALLAVIVACAVGYAAGRAGAWSDAGTKPIAPPFAVPAGRR